ncbi:MAG: PHP domain-containing protein [Candidatus Woesearchaeota archaeon]
MLKADFHIHTSEDAKDSFIKYSAKDIIRKASKLKFDVIAITNHKKVTYDKKLVDYAKKKGILLIPGIESTIEGNHVLILNATKDAEKVNTFSKLEVYKKNNKDALVIAPHPFYPYKSCLHNDFLKHIDLFDGTEFCHYYTEYFNPYNKKAIKEAKKFNKPLIGTSDVHRLYQFNKTYSLIDADKNTNSVLDALRKNKIKIKTKPLSSINCSRVILSMIMYKLLRILKRKV